LRARNDKVTAHIQGKFDYKDERKAKLLEGDYTGKYIDKGELARQQKNEQRKATEAVVKASLDEQVRLAAHQRDVERDETKKIERASNRMSIVTNKRLFRRRCSNVRSTRVIKIK